MDHPAFPYVVRRVTAVCAIAAPRTLLSDLRQRFDQTGLTAAVARHDTAALFDWLIGVLSYQGVSDAVAWGYMNRNGSVALSDIAAALEAQPSCPKLRGYWHFDACRYAKIAFSCSEPAHLEGCPLPQHDLRNGRLNQTAYALALFLREVCESDLVAWIDQRLDLVAANDDAVPAAAVGEALLDPLCSIIGTSSKVWSMALADLLLAGDPARGHWVAAGAGMIAVDTLVHNWLHRTGSLAILGAAHPYGAACYGPGGCAAILKAVSCHVDARAYCPEGPAIFPRLVQKAVWLFCTEGGLDICNGNRIDDRQPCLQTTCPLSANCARLALR